MFTDSIQPLLKSPRELPRIQPQNGVITFSFAGNNRVSTTTQNYIRYIFKNLIEPFINVRFVESAGKGNINFQLHDNKDEYAYTTFKDHNVFLGRRYDNADTPNGFQSGFGSRGFATLIHETLHAMGLDHPGNYNGRDGSRPGPFLPYNIDNTTNSIMSYNKAGQGAITPMPYDIAALQYLYGERQLNAGDTTYKFSSVYSFSDGSRTWGSAYSASKLTLWDSSGTDKLDFSNLRYSVSGYVLDVRTNGIITTGSGYNSFGYKPLDANNFNAGSRLTSGYGTRLTFNTQIEEVMGSNSKDRIFAGSATNRVNALGGNDIVYGSDANNTLLGGYGNDIVFGFGGDDILTGGTGETLYKLSYSDYSGRDWLYGGAGNDKIWGENGDDLLYGQQDDDLLFGGRGNDKLSGSSSFFSNERDLLWGGSGSDRFVLGSNKGSFYQGSGYAIIKDWEGGVDKIVLGRSSGRYSTRSQNIRGGAEMDTGIYHNDDLIGVIEDSTNVSSRRGDFVFA